MIKDREYFFSVNKFNKPTVFTGKSSIAMLLTRLILMEPGTDPLRPEMGVGIRHFRYTMKSIDDLRDRVKDQIERFLPCFQSSDVKIVLTQNKFYNIEIRINDTLFVYDSATAPVPITIDDAKR